MHNPAAKELPAPLHRLASIRGERTSNAHLAAILLTLTATLLWADEASADGPLALEGRTASSLTVSWSWSGQTASGWALDWRARGDDEIAAWRGVRKTAALRRHTIEGLDAGVHYAIRVQALDANDRPLGDLRGVFATSQSGPRMLRVTARADTALALGWAAPADWTPQGYRLRWRAVGAETALGDLPPTVVC